MEQVTLDKAEIPCVTVIAACYNHERFIVECLESIRNQTYPNIQLIITDDCSIDRSVEIIENWIETHIVRCHFIKHHENKGFPKTLNEALNCVEGKYVSIISTDDYWLPGFVSNHVEILEEAGEECGVVYGRTYTIDENGERLPTILPQKSPFPEGSITEDLLKGCFIPANTTMIRYSVYSKVGRYDEELPIEDYDMWLRISKYYQFKMTTMIHSNWRILPSSLYHGNVDIVRLSVDKIFLKLIDFFPNYRNQIENHLYKDRFFIFENGNPLAKQISWLAFRRKPSKSTLFMLVCSLLRMSFQDYKKTEKFLTRFFIRKPLNNVN